MSNLTSSDILSELAAWREAARQLVSESWDNPRDLRPTALASVLVPIDLLDAGPALVVRANMPGLDATNVSITVTGNALTIRGEPKIEPEQEGATYLRRERRASAFTRSLTLPIQVDADRAEATYRDGVLILTLPKAESVRPKTIKVQTT